MIGQPLLAGHLLLFRKLLIGHQSSKVQIGSILLQHILYVLLFPATKSIVDVHSGMITINEQTANVKPICSTPTSRIAAYEVVLELCQNCYANLEQTLGILTQLHGSAIEKFVVIFLHVS